MIKTKARTLERPRPGATVKPDGSLFEQLENGGTVTTRLLNSGGPGAKYPVGSSGRALMSAAYQSKMGNEPHIEVRIKPRAKDRPSNELMMIVTYQVCLSKEEQENLTQLVPSTPKLESRRASRKSLKAAAHGQSDTGNATGKGGYAALVSADPAGDESAQTTGAIVEEGK